MIDQTPENSADRTAQADAHVAAMRKAAADLVAQDEEFASRLTRKAAGLDNLSGG